MHFLFLMLMPDRVSEILVDKHLLHSSFLQREVIIDCYLPIGYTNLSMNLLLINDGQDLRTMGFEEILDDLYAEKKLEPILCVGIHCAPDRKNEYGTAHILDYKGRGAKAAAYTSFIFEEFLPWLRKKYNIISFREKAFAGFSLGGLCALDITWNYPEEFTKVGVFSGSLWWRDKDQDDEDFDENTDRIMHRQIREGKYIPWLTFFFEVGTLDEKADRNKNEIIDSIDDTMSLVEELEKKGYTLGKEIHYMEIKDGRHDLPTWARAFPAFLEWGWGKKRN